jgi:hypothetical protein
MKVGSDSLVLKEVLLVPGIARNLLSTTAATRRAGSACLTLEGVATLYRQGRMLVTAKVSKNDGLLTFVAEHNIPMRSVLVTEAKESPQLWHRCLNHANFDVLANFPGGQDAVQGESVGRRVSNRQERNGLRTLPVGKTDVWISSNLKLYLS